MNNEDPLVWSNKGKVFQKFKKYKDAINWQLKIINFHFFLVKTKLFFIKAKNIKISIDYHIIDQEKFKY